MLLMDDFISRRVKIMIRVNTNNRDDLIEKYIDTLVDGMDLDALIRFTKDSLNIQLEHYSNSELHDLISRIYPELLEE